MLHLKERIRRISVRSDETLRARVPLQRGQAQTLADVGDVTCGDGAVPGWWAAGPCQRSHIPAGEKYSGALRGVLSAGYPQ